MARLFVSYAHNDGSSIARRLADDLTNAGHDVWIDRGEIRGGESWSREIEDAIAACDLLLAVMTPAAFDSRVCRGEQISALDAGKRVVPLKAHIEARIPVYLKESHWIDFCAAAGYDAGLADLRGAIASARGVGREDLAPRLREQASPEAAAAARADAAAVPAADWAGLVQRCLPQQRRFLDGLAGRGRAPGIYEAALWVERAAEQVQLDGLAQGDACALVMLGDAGVGKTCLLAQWSDSCARARDAVLAYAAERVDAARWPDELARDLGVAGGAAALGDAWPRFEAMAQQAQQRLWILLDGINDARGSDAAARTLLEAFDAQVGLLPGRAIKFIVTCTPSAWQRMDRREPLRLMWGRYHHGRDDAEALVLEHFTPEQAAAAFDRHARRFGLAIGIDDLPPPFHARLREPMLLRLLAEALQGTAARQVDADFDTLVFQRFFAQRLRRREDLAFAEALAAQMLDDRVAALPIQRLSNHPTLGAAVRDETPASPCRRLLDDGVLTEVRGNLFDDGHLRFAYPQLGAYALVRHALARGEPPLASVRALAAAGAELSLAWDAAVTLLVQRGDAAAYADLAGAVDPELRELALEALVRAHAGDAARARALLQPLIERGSPEQQRVALRAAFRIGPATRELLVRGATSSSAQLRNAVRDTLFLIWNGLSRPDGETRSSALYFVWRRAPGFTYELLDELVARLSWLHPVDARRILAFVLDLMITIYVNHCERADVRDHTAALFRKLSVERLHLDRREFGAKLEGVVLRVVSAVYGERLLRWMIRDEGEDAPHSFFALPRTERSLLERAVPLLDPAADLAAAQPLLAELLCSRRGVFCGVAELVIATHAYADAAKAEPVVRALFEALDSGPRAWLLASYAVLLRDAPAAWQQLLEDLTARLAAQPDADVPRMLSFLDTLHLPLALSSAKRSTPMKLIADTLAAAARQPAAARRAIETLGVVGFYYPQQALEALRPHTSTLAHNLDTQAALVGALATIRTLHFDPVDQLLVDADVAPSLRRDIVAGGDPARVQKIVRLLGYYNNAVHYCARYPRMRRGIAERALQQLATAPDAASFVSAYAKQAITMAREARFDLLQWTQPDEAAA